MNNRAVAAAGIVTAGLALLGCGSGTSTPPTSSTTSSPATTAVVPTTAVPTTATATCPTVDQINAALRATYGRPVTTPTPGRGIFCEYPSSAGSGSASVTVFAHQSAAAFVGLVAHAPGAPAMTKLSGVGTGVYGMTTAGRSVVNAYSDASRTLVTAQARGPLPPVEALARVALADN